MEYHNPHAIRPFAAEHWYTQKESQKQYFCRTRIVPKFSALSAIDKILHEKVVFCLHNAPGFHTNGIRSGVGIIK